MKTQQEVLMMIVENQARIIEILESQLTKGLPKNMGVNLEIPYKKEELAQAINSIEQG